MASWDNKVKHIVPIQTIFQRSHAWTSLKHKLDMIKFQISFIFTLKLTFVKYAQFMFSCVIVIWFENCFNVVFNIWRHDENMIMCYVGMTLTASLFCVYFPLSFPLLFLKKLHMSQLALLLFFSLILTISQSISCSFRVTIYPSLTSTDLLLVSWSGCLLSSL